MMVNIESFAKEIAKKLSDEGTRITEEMNTIILEEANKCVENIKRDSPRRTGKYARSWYLTSTKNSLTGNAIALIHSKNGIIVNPLENGHLNRDGSRTRAFPHKKVNVDRCFDAIRNRIRNEVTK